MDFHEEPHPFLRAYMAGVTIPAVFMIGVMLVYVMARLVWELPVPVERVIAFPMAIVPNAWGLWNVLYLALHLNRRVPIGWFGAVLPLLLMPVGWQLSKAVGVEIPFANLVPAVLAVAALYYVLWRYLVAALNRIVGLGVYPCVQH